MAEVKELVVQPEPAKPDEMNKQKPAELKQQKLSKKQREEIALEYYSKNITQKELAVKYNVSPVMINRIVNDLRLMKKAREYIKKEMDKAELRRSMAIMKAVNAAPMAIDQIIRIGSQDVEMTPVQYQYVIQNAAHEILERAGVRTLAEENGNEVVVRFADPEGIFNPGMPDLENGDVDVEVDD